MLEAIQERISAHMAEFHRPPRYVLLGRRKYRELRLESYTSEQYFSAPEHGDPGEERVFGIEILLVAYEVFLDVA